MRRHLSKTVPLCCVSCGSTDKCVVTMEGVALPQGWREAMQQDQMLCSDICERRWFH